MARKNNMLEDLAIAGAKFTSRKTIPERSMKKKRC